MERTRTTLRSLRRLAILTLTLVLVAGVHVAWAPDAYSAPAEFVEQRITLNGLDADLTLERVGADYAVSINYLDEAPARISVTVQQTLYDSSDGDLMSCVDTSWSDNVSLENGRAVFVPTVVGEHATLDLGELPLRSFQRVFINLETSAATSVVVHAVITDNWGTRHELRSPSRPIAAGTTTVTQNLTYMLPSGSTRPDGLNRIHSLSVSVDGLDPVTIHSVVLTAPSVTVRPGDEDLFQFAVPISPSVAFDITVGDGTQTLLLEDLVGAITVAEYVPTPFEEGLLRRLGSRSELPESLRFVNLNFWDGYIRDGMISRSQLIQRLQELERYGFNGVSLDYWLTIDRNHSNTVYPVYSIDLTEPFKTLFTATDHELEEFLRVILEHTNLLVEVRVQLHFNMHIVKEWPDEGDRQELAPQSVESFFRNYYAAIENAVKISERYGVTIFTPFVELESLLQHVIPFHRLLDHIDQAFDGWLSVSLSTNHYLPYGNFYVYEGKRIEDSNWQALRWSDSDGRRLLIGPNANALRLSSSSNYSMESLVSSFLGLFSPAIDFYRTNLPGHPIWLGEMHAHPNQGTVMGWSPTLHTNPIDFAEMGDVLSAKIIGSRRLSILGFSLFNHDLSLDFPNTIPRELMPRLSEVIRASYGDMPDH